ncbi:MAG: hypothetical protein NVS3B3_11340 [Aquirhabdus sp.]
MCRGFECGNGWYQIIYDLSQEISGYHDLYPEMYFEVTQVKSKLGSLRFYVRGGDAVVRKMISRATLKAEMTLEGN